MPDIVFATERKQIEKHAMAIDEDWSAVRFRRVEFIKTMKRDPRRALTKKGKTGK